MAVKRTGNLRAAFDKGSRRAGLIVQATVFQIEGEAKVRARVRRGQMRAGLQGRMTGPHQGVVEGLAEHTIYNEFGTRHMSAQPMLTPAAELARPAFERAMQRAWTN